MKQQKAKHYCENWELGYFICDEIWVSLNRNEYSTAALEYVDLIDRTLTDKPIVSLQIDRFKPLIETAYL